MKNNEKNNLPEQFFVLVLKYQDGSITPRQTSELEAALLKNPEYRAAFYEFQTRSRQIHEFYSIADSQTQGLWDNSLAAGCDSTVRPKQAGIKLWIAFAAAAVFMLVAGVIYSITSREQGIASLTYLGKNVQWEGQGTYAAGDILKKGKYAIQSGQIRLRMPDNTVAILGGPSRFEILDNNTLKLEHGKVSAKVNNPESLFTVRTAMMDVIDLGTAFGVKVNKSGQSRVSVFEGTVAIKQPSKKGDNTVLLKKGHCAQIEPGQAGLVDMPYDLAEYRELWPLTNGVDEMTDKVEFLPPGTIASFESYRSDEKLFMLPERHDLLLTQPLAVDIAKPGRCERFVIQSKPAIPAGKRVSSYLLFFSQEGPKNWKNYRRLTGQITFGRPILGVIGNYQKLMNSDDIVGIEGYDYPIFMKREKDRGLDNRNPGAEEDMAHDSVMISEDRRTLSFDLSSGPWIDQFRVIVYAN